MTIRVGIIGTGLIGEDHARKLAGTIKGASVSGVTDVRLERAQEVAEAIGGARVFDSGLELIGSDEVLLVFAAGTAFRPAIVAIAR